jgi:hypothetical protein
MVELMWRAKTAFPKLKIALWHESVGERKPHEESPWKSRSGAMRGSQLRVIAIGKK